MPMISGTGTTLTKTDSGTVTLGGTSANTYTGTTTVNAGVMNIQNNTALGTATLGTTVNAGAALEVQGGLTAVAENITLNGTGVGGNGALRNVAGANTLTGALTLASASEIQSDAGTLTLNGNIGGAAQNLTLDGAGNITIGGVIGTTSAYYLAQAGHQVTVIEYQNRVGGRLLSLPLRVPVAELAACGLPA